MKCNRIGKKCKSNSNQQLYTPLKGNYTQYSQFISIYSLKLGKNTQEYILFSYDNNSSEAVIGVLLNKCFSDLQFIIKTYAKIL